MRPALRFLSRLGYYLLVAFVLVYSAFPFYWAVVSSFKPAGALFSPTPASSPSHLPGITTRMFSSRPTLAATC